MKRIQTSVLVTLLAFGGLPVNAQDVSSFTNGLRAFECSGEAPKNIVLGNEDGVLTLLGYDDVSVTQTTKGFRFTTSDDRSSPAYLTETDEGWLFHLSNQNGPEQGDCRDVTALAVLLAEEVVGISIDNARDLSEQNDKLSEQNGELYKKVAELEAKTEGELRVCKTRIRDYISQLEKCQK